MRSVRRRVLMSGVVLGLLGASGCSTYYRVTDPASGREYYTNNWMAGRYNMNGAVNFTDARTGKSVTLQSSEVQQISQDEYEAGVLTR